MKKIVLASALLLVMSSTFANNATTATSMNISMKNPLTPPHNPASIAAFNALFPGATTIKWQIKGEIGYQVTFIYNGVKMTAKFSYAGVYLGA